MTPAEHFMQLVAKDGQVARYYDHACMELFGSLTVDQQRYVYRRVRDKLNAHAYVPYNPVEAIRENLKSYKAPKPIFLRGDEKGIDIVQVRYEGKYKLCSRKTAEEFGMAVVRNWR